MSKEWTAKLDALLASDDYMEMCKRLQAKYPLKSDKEDYSEAYWEEFNKEFGALKTKHGI